MDSVGGTQNAPTVAAELEHEVTGVNKHALTSLGLDGLWSSLKRLAETGPATRRTTEENTLQLSTQVAELSSRCSTLETEVFAERQRAETIEEALYNEAQKVQSLIGTIQWASGDVMVRDRVDINDDISSRSSTKHLELCVDALGSAVQRFVRRYRAISRHVMVPSEDKILKNKKTLTEKKIGTIPAHSAKRSVHGVDNNDADVDEYEYDENISLRARYSTPEVSL